MKSPRTSVHAFADAAAALVNEHNVADVLVQLMSDCAEVLGASAAAILMVDSDGELSLLTSSSHRAVELELLQIQGAVGPCVEAIVKRRRVTVREPAELVRRWGDVGRVIAEAGVRGIEAIPLTWRGRVLGGLNIFFRDASAAEREENLVLGQAFADMATLVVVQSTQIPADQVSARVHEAVMARAQIEQAKGVLAYVEGVDMGAAFELLRSRARSSGRSLSETAAAVVRRQWNG